MRRIHVITGTDTGVGKTVVTALLAAHLPAVIALKPFCSGERSDAELLAGISGQPIDRINPWFFPEPISPWTAARRRGLQIRLPEVAAWIRAAAAETVLVEGAGGLLAPLGEGFSALELIRELDCEAILVAPNRLGVLNQVRMAARVLGDRPLKVALTGQAGHDPSMDTNLADLRELLPFCTFVPIPFLPDLVKIPGSFRSAAPALASGLDRLSS